MTASVWHRRLARKAGLALIGIMGTLQWATAEPISPNNSGLTAAQCYGKDSGCTQFCGQVTGDLRYECFSICDRMLDHCLETGDWTDSARIDPGTGRPPTKTSQLSAFFMRMMMTLGDTDGDGVLTQKEIESVKQRVFKGVDDSGGAKPTTAPKQ